jgi:hypothetical protein
MTETTRRHGGMDALACQVTLYRRDTYLAVKFILKNLREEVITVDYRQTVPDDLTTSHLSFTSEYMGDAWVFEDARLEFTADIPAGEQIETVYGIKRVDIPDLVDFIRYATIVATQDGKTIETVTGLEPDIEGGGDATEESTDDGTGSVETSDRSADDESSPETDSGGERTEASEGAQSDELSGPDDRQRPAGTGNDPPVMDESAGRAESPEQQPSNGETASRPASGTEDDGRPGDDSDATRDRSAETQGRSIEWETLTPEEDTTAVVEGSDATTTTDNHVPFAGEESGHEPEMPGDRPPALPANRSDYILEDVRGEIESSGEFEWIDLADDADETDDASGREDTNNTDDASSSVLGWIRSRLSL